jgi:hypothetical protein
MYCSPINWGNIQISLTFILISDYQKSFELNVSEKNKLIISHKHMCVNAVTGHKMAAS